MNFWTWWTFTGILAAVGRIEGCMFHKGPLQPHEDFSQNDQAVPGSPGATRLTNESSDKPSTIFLATLSRKVFEQHAPRQRPNS